MADDKLVQGDVVRSMTGTIVNCDHQKMLVFVNELKNLMKNGQFFRIGNVDTNTMDKIVLAASDSKLLRDYQKKFFDSSLG